MKIILENQETGEIKTIIGTSGKFKKPWKIKEVIHDGKSNKEQVQSKLAVMATKWGIPVPQLLDAARWILKKECPFCQMGTQLLKRIDELGEAKAAFYLTKILAAKQANDLDELDRIKAELDGQD